jgi:hypothetical protein
MRGIEAAPFFKSMGVVTSYLFRMATELTRRPDRQGWFIYFGDVCIGHIGMRSGVPVSEPQWGWTCGFSPGCDSGQQTHGTGETFEEARAQFVDAWNRLRPTRTEAHFELWRHHRDWTAWKYRMHDKGLKLPTETKNDLARCFCGVEITNRSMKVHIVPPRHRQLGPLRLPDISVLTSIEE